MPKLATRQTAMPVVPPQARQSTLNINAIHGGARPRSFEGTAQPLVADRCRLVIDRRFLLEEDLAAVKAEITGILDQLQRERPHFATASRTSWKPCRV